MYHYRKTRKAYKSYPKHPECEFCDFNDIAEKIIEETDHARVIKNRVFYDIWEMRDVTEHLMIVPKRHVKKLKELSDEEKLDIMNTIARYEALGFNIYAREPNSLSRSVAHQHTHLIKTGKKPGKALFFSHKPYFVIKF